MVLAKLSEILYVLTRYFMVKLVHIFVKNGHLEAGRKLVIIRKHADHALCEHGERINV